MEISVRWPHKGYGWMLWHPDRSVPDNLSMLRGHVVRVAGFEALGGRGCVCGWWEPPGICWPGWLWRKVFYRTHKEYECDGSDIYSEAD